MRVVVQRVSQASVEITGITKASIDLGLMVLVGMSQEDNEEDVIWITDKLIALRIFGDQEGKMNLNIQDVSGDFLVVSQFTLFASTKKGNRPSFIRSARPEQAIPLYNYFISLLENKTGKKIATGEFGADMKIALTNDGPVTIIIDSKLKE